MNPDSARISSQIAQSSINWLQIAIQTGALTIIFAIVIEILRRRFQKDLEFLKSEFAIIQTTFSNNYSLVIEFYSALTKYYRSCQDVVNSDFTTYQEKPAKHTKELFMEQLDQNVHRLRELDPKIRLIFPDRVFTIYTQMIIRFNEFRDLVKSYADPSRKPKKELNDKFTQIDTLKTQLEAELKQYLRTEKLYPN